MLSWDHFLCRQKILDFSNDALIIIRSKNDRKFFLKNKISTSFENLVIFSDTKNGRMRTWTKR